MTISQPLVDKTARGFYFKQFRQFDKLEGFLYDMI